MFIIYQKIISKYKRMNLIINLLKKIYNVNINSFKSKSYNTFKAHYNSNLIRILNYEYVFIL